MAENKVFNERVVQIIFACLVPNFGALIIFIVLSDRLEDSEEKVKSFLDQPEWVALIALIFLFTTSGFASWRVHHIGKERAKIPLLIYAITVLLNWLWPLITFGLGSIVGAIIDTIILQVFVVIAGIAFFRIDKISGVLFIPYLLYLIYILVLWTHIYVLN